MDLLRGDWGNAAPAICVRLYNSLREYLLNHKKRDISL